MSISIIVDRARTRLARVGMRAEIGRRAAIMCAFAAMCAAARPVVWSMHGGDPLRAAGRAVLLAAAGASMALAVCLVQAWRRRPSRLASARRLDGALGLAEVVASGFAFERDARNDAMARFAVARAHRAVEGVALEQLLVFEPHTRSRAEVRRLYGAVAALVVGLGLGSVDRIVIERLIHPVTARESAAVAELRHAAEVAANAERGPDGEKRPQAEELALAARRASDAAERGDRRGANEALEDMRKAARALEAEQRDQARSLRALRDELEGASAAARGGAGEEGKERSGRPSATATDALAQLKKELDAKGGDKEALRKLIERLERAESAARAAAEKDSARSGEKEKSSGKDGKRGTGERPGKAGESAWSRAAAALKEAREAAARGDAEGVKRAMERAERELAALEKASRDPSREGAMARMSEGATELGRAMHAATSGDPSGKSERDGSASTDKSKSAAGSGHEGREGRSSSNERSNASGAPGTGPGGADRAPGPEQRRLKVNGDLQARADVRAGERAVSALEGMGRGGDPRAYREIFPSYDTVVEDGLREDTVPAARRPTVRRYFSSIRPGGDDESRK